MSYGFDFNGVHGICLANISRLQYSKSGWANISIEEHFLNVVLDKINRLSTSALFKSTGFSVEEATKLYSKQGLDILLIGCDMHKVQMFLRLCRMCSEHNTNAEFAGLTGNELLFAMWEYTSFSQNHSPFSHKNSPTDIYKAFTDDFVPQASDIITDIHNIKMLSPAPYFGHQYKTQITYNFLQRLRYAGDSITLDKFRDWKLAVKSDADWNYHAFLGNYEVVEAFPDLLMFSGGADIDPTIYGEEKESTTHISKEHDTASNTLYAYHPSIPRFGICRGFQYLSARCGNKLIQHNAQHLEFNRNNRHVVNSPFGEVETNSMHHQSVKMCNNYAYNIATCADGTIEAAVYPYKMCAGVQWHPEFGGSGKDVAMKYLLEIL